MKKGLYAILAILTIFAMTVMVGCPDSPSDDPPVKITISYELDTDSAPSSGATATAPVDVKINKGSAIGAANLPTIIEGVPAGWMLDGWYTYDEDTGAYSDDKVDAADRFSVNTTLYAFWVEPVTIQLNWNHDSKTTNVEVPKGGRLSALQLAVDDDENGNYSFISWYNESVFTTVVTTSKVWDSGGAIYAKWRDPIDVTFELDGGEYTNGDPNYTTTIRVGSTMANSVNSKLPKVKKDDNAFVKWVIKDSDPEVEITEEYLFEETLYWTASTNVTTDIELIAIWYSTKVDASDFASDWIEEIMAENNGYAVYEFDLDGAEFSEYATISAKFKVSEAMFNGSFGQVRNTRLMGNYAMDDDALPVKYDGNGNFYFDLQNGANAPYIYDDMGKSWADFDTAFPDAANGAWFELTFKLVGNSPNGGFEAKNRPADDFDGKLYFGFGFSGTDAGFTYYVKDITMNPSEESSEDPILGSAVYVEDEVGFEGPLFVAYKNGGDYVRPTRKTVNGAELKVVLSFDGEVAPPCECTSDDDPHECDCEEWIDEDDHSKGKVRDACWCFGCLICHPDYELATEAMTLTFEKDDIKIYGTNGTNYISVDNDGVISVDINVTAGAGFYVAFPGATWDIRSYTTVTVNYTATIDASSAASKVVLKKGADSWTDISGSQYKDIEAGENTWNLTPDNFAGYTTPGISFQIGNSAAADVPQKWTFKIDSIVFGIE